MRYGKGSATVVEREFPGFGASGRNGGLLLQGPAQLLGEATRLIGTQAALQFLLLTRRTRRIHFTALLGKTAQKRTPYDPLAPECWSAYDGEDSGQEEFGCKVTGKSWHRSHCQPYRDTMTLISP